MSKANRSFILDKTRLNLYGTSSFELGIGNREWSGDGSIANRLTIHA